MFSRFKCFSFMAAVRYMTGQGLRGPYFLQVLKEDFGDDGAGGPGKCQSDGTAAGGIQRA